MAARSSAPFSFRSGAPRHPASGPGGGPGFVPIIVACLARIKGGRHVATVKAIRRNESGSGTDWSADVVLLDGAPDVLRGDGRSLVLSTTIKVGDKIKLAVDNETRIAKWDLFDPEKDSGAIEQKIRRKRRLLDADLLLSPDGIPALVSVFPKISTKGPGHETQDLHTIMHFYRQWAFKLFPKMHFQMFSQRTEKLGSEGRLRNSVGMMRDEVVFADRKRSQPEDTPKDEDEIDSDLDSDLDLAPLPAAHSDNEFENMPANMATSSSSSPPFSSAAIVSSSGQPREPPKKRPRSAGKKKRLKRIGGGSADIDSEEEVAMQRSAAEALDGLDNMDWLFESMEFPAEAMAPAGAEPVPGPGPQNSHQA